MKIRASIDFFGPLAIGLGVHLDTQVVRTGDEGIETGTDLDLTLLWWQVVVTLYRVRTPYRVGEGTLDAMLRDDTAHP